MKYNVTINKEDILKLNNVEISEVIPDENELNFKTNDQSLKFILNKIEKIKYENIRKKKILSFLKKYCISIIFLFLMILLLINDSLIVKEIVFVNENTYDQEVVNYIKQNYKKVFVFNYLSRPIHEINNDLKNNFYFYEWINVYKKGNKLLITIDKQDDKSYINTKSRVKGDIVAGENGIIRYYFVKEGVCIIKDNQSVKKGDILVSGNLDYYNNKSKYIHPSAIILAEVVSKEKIKIKKNNEMYIKTGNIKIDSFYSMFSKEKDYFDMYEYTDETIFSIGKIKKIKRTYYEIALTNNVYNKDSSYLYALSIIDKNFNEKKVHEKETILEKELIDSSEDNDYFYYSFLVKKIVNISRFQAVRLEE